MMGTSGPGMGGGASAGNKAGCCGKAFLSVTSAIWGSESAGGTCRARLRLQARPRPQEWMNLKRSPRLSAIAVAAHSVLHMAEHVLPETRLRPVLYVMLFMPMGITNGYTVVALAYLLSKTGVSVGLIAGFVGLSLFPQTWRAVWAPVVDTTLSIRAWYLISASATGLLMAVTAFIPASRANFGWIELLAVGFSLAAT